ncbi:enoyl-CoA hydratase [Antricoccus suffuscus]|uniref:Enoyl-CoA hydratase n=1 Tax=Antricoccus suffuscus TaxID=1629062 RepID=A0A2T1A070_9ACTN|nr:enoyl-CoA hydratase/isomerase family protein [Antricoccus suffuscus]PRZ41992.1 enoyl-CoA hydratase [Antricoccus suffuscus]
MDYAGKYEHMLFELHDDGVLLITLNRPERYNATNEALHRDLGLIWRDIDDDPDVRVAVVTGAGKAFSAGGDMEMLERMTVDPEKLAIQLDEASAIVYNMINCNKPIISAINGVAVGAGLTVALMADISIIAEEARLTDGHLRLGVGAGDHAVIIWPLLCGMAKAKYYLLTADFIDGPEAERIGLVSRCVPGAVLMDTAMEVAQKLAKGPQHATRWTKRTLNNWLRTAGPAFDASVALEMLAFLGEDAKEGVNALQEKRSPTFPSAAG